MKRQSLHSPGIAYFINEFVDGPLPLEEDLVEAAERAGVGHVPRVGDRHPGPINQSITFDTLITVITD